MTIGRSSVFRSYSIRRLSHTSLTKYPSIYQWFSHWLFLRVSNVKKLLSFWEQKSSFWGDSPLEGVAQSRRHISIHVCRSRQTSFYGSMLLRVHKKKSLTVQGAVLKLDKNEHINILWWIRIGSNQLAIVKLLLKGAWRWEQKVWGHWRYFPYWFTWPKLSNCI